jgi:hypothetical protein
MDESLGKDAEDFVEKVLQEDVIPVKSWINEVGWDNVSLLVFTFGQQSELALKFDLVNELQVQKFQHTFP